MLLLLPPVTELELEVAFVFVDCFEGDSGLVTTTVAFADKVRGLLLGGGIGLQAANSAMTKGSLQACCKGCFCCN